MSDSVSLSCSCGAVKGQLQVVCGHYFHVKCLCCDCQRFAKELNKADGILDEHGGTELFQTHPQYMQITEGKDNIACLQLREKGLYRWFARCCNTPIGNTMTAANVPFVGIPVAFMQFADEDEKQNSIGPVSMQAFGKYAIGNMPDNCHEKFPLSYMPKIIAFMIRGLVTKKYSPSPFFNGKAPITAARLV